MPDLLGSRASPWGPRRCKTATSSARRTPRGSVPTCRDRHRVARPSVPTSFSGAPGMRISKRWLVAATCTAGLVLGFQPAVGAPRAAVPGLSVKAMAQIEALAAAKAARTPADNKVESPLLTAAQLSRGRAPAAARGIRPAVPTDPKGRARVDLKATVTPALLRRIAAVGGEVRDADRKAGVVSADVPMTAVQQLASLPEVRHIGSMAATPITSAIPGRAAATGAVVSEGDAAHGAAQARERLGVSGIGITVGVLSDGVDSLRQSVASGDLPPDVQVLPGAAGSGDEGTAMLQIVHDLAPKARLAFATANDGPDALADNIRALRAAGADVLVDDVLYFGESPFQDGPIAQAVLDVTRDGAVYLSSAGNEGSVDAGTSGNYEATFTPSGRFIGKFAGVAHDFDAGPAVQAADPLSTTSAGQPTVLQWAEPLGAASVDYDLYVLNQADEVVAFSNTVQNGDDDAFEGLFLPFSATPLRLAVTRFSGPDRYFQLTTFGGRFRADGALQAFATPGVTRGHSAVPAAISVAAAPAATPYPFALEDGDPPNPAGPYPRSFTSDQQPERFSSDGPRRVFFTPRGAPLTPGDLTATGGVVRAKPDLTAADGVSTTLVGFKPFFGTSAAAPHAAAIAALALSGRPGISPARLRAALRRTSLDLGRRGRDRDTGAGVVLAGALLDAVGARAQPYAVVGQPVVTSSTDGDAFLEPGESGTVRVPVNNAGEARATGISVTVTSPTSGVSVRPAIASYGPL